MLKRQRAIWLLVLVAGLCLTVAHSRVYRNLFEGYCLDDAYISFRYADNLAAGAGLVFNVGERVEGYSNFLWVVMLAPFATFQEDLSSAATILGLLLALLSLVVAARGLRDIQGVTSPWALGSMLPLIAGSGYFAAWAISGLETGLYAFLLTSAWYRYSLEQRDAGKRWPLSALLFAGLALARPDGALLCVAAILWHLLAHRRAGVAGTHRHVWLFPLLILAILVGYHAWRFAWFGFYLLPNSVEAKTGGGVYQVLRGLRYFAGNFLLPYLPLLASVFLLRRRNPPAGTALGQILLWGYLGTFVVAGGDWSWGRFFGPILPLASLLFVGMIWHQLKHRPAALPHAISAVLMIITLLYAAFAANITSRQRTWVQWSEYITGDRERVAIGKNGALDVRVVEAVGLVDVVVRRLGEPELGVRGRPQRGRSARGHQLHRLRRPGQPDCPLRRRGRRGPGAGLARGWRRPARRTQSRYQRSRWRHRVRILGA